MGGRFRRCPSTPVRRPGWRKLRNALGTVPSSSEGFTESPYGKETVVRHFEWNWDAPRTQSENPFKCCAYSNAARVIKGPAGDREKLPLPTKSL